MFAYSSTRTVESIWRTETASKRGFEGHEEIPINQFLFFGSTDRVFVFWKDILYVVGSFSNSFRTRNRSEGVCSFSNRLKDTISPSKSRFETISDSNVHLEGFVLVDKFHTVSMLPMVELCAFGCAWNWPEWLPGFKSWWKMDFLISFDLVGRSSRFRCSWQASYRSYA